MCEKPEIILLMQVVVNGPENSWDSLQTLGVKKNIFKEEEKLKEQLWWAHRILQRS